MGLFDYPGEKGGTESLSSLSPSFIFLENLPAASWKKILAHADVMHLQPGQIVIDAGEREDSFYILSAGTVEVVVKSANKETVLATISEGSVFGEIAFFDGEPRSATIRAKADGSAIRITRESFDRLSSWEPALARAILFDLGKVLALRLRGTTKLARS
jgi:CRP-like cAMP-binding protein